MVGTAPISANDQDTFDDPSKVLPVLPTVKVLDVVNLAALPVVFELILVGNLAGSNVPLVISDALPDVAMLENVGLFVISL